MKKGLLGGTALAGAATLAAGAVFAAEAPTWKLSGNMNFQFYWVDQDATGVVDSVSWLDSGGGTTWKGITNDDEGSISVFGAGTADSQDHDWYFGVDEAELALNVSGTADNGLNYGFKIEIQVDTDDGPGGVADEARIELSGGWGTLQLGDEDGAEDIMNYGGENLMGATGGFDGDFDDYLFRAGGGITNIASRLDNVTQFNVLTTNGNRLNVAAPSYPTISGDTGDATKVTYYSPRFSGFQVGASITPTPNTGDDFKVDGAWENHIGLGANYDNRFGNLRIRASVVYSTASNAIDENIDGTVQAAFEDLSAWSVGGIVGWGPFSIGANYTDNGDSGQPKVLDDLAGAVITAPFETSYWNVAASFESGPMYFSVGYFSSILEVPTFSESTYDHLALTADYTVAPGLGVYAEINLISDELLGDSLSEVYIDGGPEGSFVENGISMTNDTTSLIIGVNVSF